MLQCVDYSLRQLRMSYLDLILVHWPTLGDGGPDPGTEARRNTWRGLEASYRAGKVRALGVSNYDIEHLKETLAIASVPLSVNQIAWSPMYHDESLRTFCHGKGIQLQAYSPLGGWRDSASSTRHPTILRIARRLGVSAAHVALKWSLQRGVAVVSTTENPAHLRENLHLSAFSLSETDMTAINSIQVRTASSKVLVSSWYSCDTALSVPLSYSDAAVDSPIVSCPAFCEELGRMFARRGLAGLLDAVYIDANMFVPRDSRNSWVAGPHHLVGSWLVFTQPSLLPELVHLITRPDRYYDSVLHNAIWAWSLANWRQANLPTATTFWQTLLEDWNLGTLCSARRVGRVGLTKCMHGIGHGAFYLIASRQPRSPLQAMSACSTPRPHNADVEFGRVELFAALSMCCAAPSSAQADGCASGVYHSYFFYSSKVRHVNRTTWFWPCVEVPFMNVCFSMMFILGNALQAWNTPPSAETHGVAFAGWQTIRSDSLVRPFSDSFLQEPICANALMFNDTQAACAYGQTTYSVMRQTPPTGMDLVSECSRWVGPWMNLLAYARFYGCIDAVVDRINPSSKDVSCQQLLHAPWPRNTIQKALSRCRARESCGPGLGGCSVKNYVSQRAPCANSE